MNEPQDKDLDRLLHDWIDAQLRDRVSDQDLSQSILDRVDNEVADPNWRTESERKTHRTSQRSRWSSRLAWFSLGVAASTVAAILVSVWLTSQRPNKPMNLAGPPRVGASQPTDLALQAEAFSEMRAIFGDNFAWLAETDGKVILGIQSQALASRADATPITIRMEVMVRRPGETDWQASWSVDCVMLDSEVVEVPADRGSHNRWMAWAHILSDGMITVDSTLLCEDLDGDANAYDIIHQPGVRRSVFESQDGAVEYRVFQTATTLGKDVG